MKWGGDTTEQEQRTRGEGEVEVGEIAGGEVGYSVVLLCSS